MVPHFADFVQSVQTSLRSAHKVPTESCEVLLRGHFNCTNDASVSHVH